jgi:hypothetical protein
MVAFMWLLLQGLGAGLAVQGRHRPIRTGAKAHERPAVGVDSSGRLEGEPGSRVCARSGGPLPAYAPQREQEARRALSGFGERWFRTPSLFHRRRSQRPCQGLGGRRRDDHDFHEHGFSWRRMADPEGNEFCLIYDDEASILPSHATG